LKIESGICATRFRDNRTQGVLVPRSGNGLPPFWAAEA
jgi:hypothetical protein